MTPKLRGLPRAGEATTFSVPGASHPGSPGEAKAKNLLRSIAVLDGWLEDNEGRLEDEVRVRRMKRWRAEALQQLGLENQTDRGIRISMGFLPKFITRSKPN